MSSKPSTSTSKSASPAPEKSSTSATTATGGGSSSKSSTHKPHNVFSNDGSFMERFKSMKQGSVGGDKQDGKLKMNQALQRKKAMEDRIRNRGKRLQSPGQEEGDEDSTTSKKRRKDGDEDDDETDVYLREVRKLERSTLKDSGSGVRSLVK